MTASQPVPDAGSRDERACICVPCTTPGYGHPSYAHCAACCYGTLIAGYDHDCPWPDHREWAVKQPGPKPEASA